MIDVEKGGLRPLQQDGCAVGERIMQQVHRVRKIRQQTLRERVTLCHHFIDIEQRFVERRKHRVFLCCAFLHQGAKSFTITNLAGSHADALHFVGIRGPDALQRRAEFRFTTQ